MGLLSNWLLGFWH